MRNTLFLSFIFVIIFSLFFVKNAQAWDVSPNHSEFACESAEDQVKIGEPVSQLEGFTTCTNPSTGQTGCTRYAKFVGWYYPDNTDQAMCDDSNCAEPCSGGNTGDSSGGTTNTGGTTSTSGTTSTTTTNTSTINTTPQTQVNSSIGCNEGDITLSANPVSVIQGGQISFTVASGDASTYIHDYFGGGTADDNNDGVTCSNSFYPTRTCKMTGNPGTYTWTHTWQHCIGNTSNCSGVCQKSTTYTITGSATPTPTPTTPVATATPTPTGAPTATPTPISHTIKYRVAETAAGLDTAPDQPYDNFEHQDPVTFSYTFKDQTPGEKWLYVRFISDTGTKKDVRQKILFLPEPKVKNITCGYDSSTGVGTLVTIKGINIGSHDEQGKGNVKVNGADATILSWVMQGVTPNVAVLQSSSTATSTSSSSAQSTSSGSETLYQIVAKVPDKLSGRLTILLTTDSGITLTGVCNIGITTVDFSALSQCREAGSYTLSDVSTSITEAVDNAKPLFNQKINIDAKGKPQNFSPKLEVGKTYNLIVKGPYTLARKVKFTAEEGTTTLPNLTLLVGNIFPVPPDTTINSFDKAELAREWALVEDVTRRGDFNADLRVNSVDYACMRLNIGQVDEN